MIKFSDTEIINEPDFDKYLKIKGYSHSFLKSEIGGISPEFIKSDKVIIGSLVDGILTSPKEVDITHEYYDIAKKMAVKVAKEFDYEMWCFLKSQISFTSTLSCGNISMKVKGRVDKLHPGISIYDLKVTFCTVKQIKSLVKIMGYENQVWLYSHALECKKDAALVFYSVPDDKLHIHYVDVSSNENDFFIDKLLKFGT